MAAPLPRRVVFRYFRPGAQARIEAVVALLLLAGVAQGWVARQTVATLALPLLILCALGAAAALLLDRLLPDRRPALEAGFSVVRWWWPGWVAAYTGIICAAYSARLVTDDALRAQWWWLAAVLLPTVALLVPSV